MSDNKIYTAPPVLAEFHRDSSPMRLVRGPIGSGKSVGMVMEIMIRAQNHPPDANGVRRSRCAVIRNTLSQLKSTCLVTLQEWLRPISHYKVSDQTIYLRFPLPDGTKVECDVLMLPLDTPENVQRLLSLELTFAWCSEFRELPLEIVQAVYSRCGRYPSRANVKDYWYGLWGETNSFSEDSAYYDFLELERPGNVAYFIQPGAFEEGAENRENLPPRYYEEMLESNTPEWANQYIHNKITPSLSGQAVFRNSFSTMFHVSKEELNPIPGYPMIIGMDFARHPAAIFGQIDNQGRLLILQETDAENCGVERFIDEFVKPLLYQPRFAGIPSYIVGDPAGAQRSQIGEESVFEALKRLGFAAIPAQTNPIDPRLRAVEGWLNRSREGKAMMLFDGRNCPNLILSMQSKYRFKIRKTGEMEDKPEKTRPWADLADALQYLCLGTASNLRGRVMSAMGQRPPPQSQVASGGWT
jgi:hypothetical protein